MTTGLETSRREPFATLGLAVVGVVLTSIVFVVADAEISASRELSNDVLFRGSEANVVAPYSNNDPSGYSFWLPQDVYLRRWLRRGVFPTWIPNHGLGFSPIAAIYPGLLHPARWTTVLVPERQAQTLLVVEAVAAAIAGAFLLLRALGLRRGPALIAAALFATSPHMACYVTFDQVLVFAHAPWVALTGLALGERASPMRVAVFSVVIALTIASGHPTVALSTGLAGAGVALAGSTQLVRAVSRLLVGVALGLLLAAPVVLPALLELRTAWTYKVETGFGVSYWVLSLEGWLSALRLMVTGEERSPSPQYWGGGFEYFGPATLALAALGAFARAQSRIPRRALHALLLAAFVLCVPGPWMQFARHLPFPGLAGVSYLFVILELPIAIAVGCGLQQVTAIPILGRRSLQALIGAVLIVIPLSRMGHLWLPFRQTWPTESPALDAVRAGGGRSLSLHGHALVPLTGLLFNLEGLRAQTPLTPRRLRALMLALDPGVDRNSFPTYLMPMQLDAPLLQAFEVSTLIEPLGETSVFLNPLPVGPMWGPVFRNPAPPPEAWTPVFEDNFVRVWRSRKPIRARASFGRVPFVFTSSLEESVERLQGDPTLGTRSDVVETSNPSGFRSVDGDTGAVLSTLRPRPDEVVFDVEAPAPRLLVVSDLYAEGWSAEIGDEPTEIVPVNVAARGVLVPAGRHVVTMRYDVPGLMPGVALFLVGCTGLAAALARERVSLRRRRSATTAEMPSASP